MEQLFKKLDLLIKPERLKIKNHSQNHKKLFKNFKIQKTFIKTYDKITLPLTIYKNNKKTDKTIIYNHSYASCKNEGLSILNTCLELKANLCIYDSRGCGESSESEITFGFKEKFDLLFVILKNIFFFGNKEFVLWGRSMGCNSILQFLVFFENFKGFFKFEKKNYHIGKKNKQIGKKNINNKFNEDKNEKFMSFKKYFDIFFEEYNKFKNFNFDFTILGIVLDAPYISFSSFVKENIKKKFFFGFLFSKPINLFLEKWLKKKINIDITKFQNNHLIRKININTVFIISKNDNFVSIEKSLKLIKNFNLFCKKKIKNKPQVFFHPKKHGSKRPLNILHQSFDFVLKNSNSTNNFFFIYDNENYKLFKEFEKNTEIKNVDDNFFSKNIDSKKKLRRKRSNTQFYENTKKDILNNKKKINENKFRSIENKKKFSKFNSVKEHKEKNNESIFEERDLNQGFSRRKTLKKYFSLAKINSYKNKLF